MSKSSSIHWTPGDRQWINAAIDCDGDIWAQRESGVWVCLTDASDPTSTEVLAEKFRPIAFAKADR